MMEVCLQARLQVFNASDTYNIITVHNSSTSDERTCIILYTVTTVHMLYTPKRITVELFCSPLVVPYMYCICAELRDD